MQLMKTFLTAALALPLALGLVACDDDGDSGSTPGTTPNTIADLAAATGDLSTLNTALGVAGLDATLAEGGPYTVFAPVDSAFAAIPEADLNALLDDPAALAEVLKLHVVSGAFYAADVVNLTQVTTLEGSALDVVVTDGTVTIGGATVTATDIEADNGIIHLIDTVILPAPTEPTEPGTIIEVAEAAGDFTTLLTAVEAAGLTATLSGTDAYTVLAPTDAAFANLPEGLLESALADTDLLTDVLLYHVIEGSVTSDVVVTLTSATMLNGDDVTISVDGDGNVMINDAMVTVVDIPASNGVIHVIDAVLIPPMEEEPGTIIDVATAAGTFGTLLAAVDAAGLTDTLSGDTAYTVFAPTDDAFAKLGEETISALLADVDTLTEILLYHVVEGTVTSETVVSLDSATTAQGQDVSITVVDGNVMVNDAMITAVDIPASNGIIHVIDTVILPPEELPTIAEIATADGNFGTLLAAVDAAGLTATLADPSQDLTVFAPTDAAFAALPEGTVAALLEDIPALTNILEYHIVAGTVTSDVVVTLESATTLNGQPVTISVEGGNVFINDAQVVVVDLLASNGVVHVIDTVLLPPAEELPTIAEIATDAGTFGTLLAAVDAAGLTGTLADPSQDLTVFAPTDAAFAALPEGTVEALLGDIPTLTAILQYHLVNGSVFSDTVVTLDTATTLGGSEVNITVVGDTVFLNNAMVTAVDIEASNGVIHVIDAVLIPDGETMPSIAQIATAEGSFTTLLAAVDAAGLTGTLADPSQELTVMAPTDAAFAALPEGTVEGLLADIPALTNILQYHIVAGFVTSDIVVTLPSATMLNGQDITISVSEGVVTINGSATVTAVDIMASNGVIHVIDAVLLPPTGE